MPSHGTARARRGAPSAAPREEAPVSQPGASSVSLCRRKAGLLAEVRSVPAVSPGRMVWLRGELAKLADVPILSHHELQRLE